MTLSLNYDAGALSHPAATVLRHPNTPRRPENKGRPRLGLWENNPSRLLAGSRERERERERELAESLTTSLLEALQIRWARRSEQRTRPEDEARRIDESITLYVLPRGTSASRRHPIRSWLIESHPAVSPIPGPRVSSILRSQVSCDLTSGDTVQSSDIKTVYIARSPSGYQ